MIEAGRRHKRWVSLPYTDYCPPLARGRQETVGLSQRLNLVRGHHGLQAIELRADDRRWVPDRFRISPRARARLRP